MAGKFGDERSNRADTLGSAAIEHTPADEDLPINIKAVVFDADGTMSFKNASGGEITGFPVAKGAPVSFVPARITDMDGPTKCFLIQ